LVRGGKVGTLEGFTADLEVREPTARGRAGARLERVSAVVEQFSRLSREEHRVWQA